MTFLSGASISLSAAVIVTVPVLVCEPAAMVSVLFAVMEKSEAVAGETGVAATVRMTSWLETALSVAVTVLVPPSSSTADALSASDTVGVPSSSVIVSFWSDGAATSLPPSTVAETVTSLSGASTSLSAAVIVTVPVLVCEPAAMVSVLFAVMEKSEAVAGETGVAETVRVTSWLETALSVAVTVLAPPSSTTDDALSARETVGVASSSLMVNV